MIIAPIRTSRDQSMARRAASLIDEMEINLVPTLPGSGERLFDGVGDSLHGLDLVRTVATPRVTLKFEKQ